MNPELVPGDWVISFKGIDHQELKQKIGLIQYNIKYFYANKIILLEIHVYLLRLLSKMRKDFINLLIDKSKAKKSTE